MIDLHCHILPGLDDGASDPDTTLKMAQAAAAEGTELMVATPHVNGEYAPNREQVLDAVRETNDALGRHRVPLVVSPGVELGVTQAMDMSRPELAGLTLGGSSTLLLESPYSDAVRFFDRAVFELTANGFRVLLAHPERSPLFRKDPGLLERLVESGTLCSLTAGSLAGRFGRSVRDFSRELLERELIHNVASDAHDLDRRPPGLKAGSSEIPPPLFSWLSEHVPRAILTDAPLPDRPSAPDGRRTRRRRWRRGRRL